MASQRSIWLGAGLALTLAATWYAAGVDDAGDDLLADPQRPVAPTRSAGPADAAPRAPFDAPTASAPAQATVPTVPPTTDLSTDERMTRDGGNLFAAQSWQPPPPPPVAAAPAPPPRAPALPFKYLGRMEEDGRVVAFVGEGPQQVPRVLRQGDVLPQYRVDAITPQGMSLTYLPLNETQRLLFGSAQ